jgi:hypothetical protein
MSKYGAQIRTFTLLLKKVGIMQLIELIRISDTERNINVNIGKLLQEIQGLSVLW